MRRPGLLPIAWRLKQRGFAPILFSYSTLWQSPELAMERLAQRLAAHGGEPMHLLAHSLGGLIAVETLNRHPDLPHGPAGLPRFADCRERRGARPGAASAGLGLRQERRIPP